MNQPEPQPVGFQALLADVERGLIKIPRFQRDFVWTRAKAAKLIDSILRGYPIGTFILWKTKDRLRSVREMGGVTLPEPPAGDFVYYVLDGQQRLTSLLASVRGWRVQRSEHEEDFSELCVSLNPTGDDLVLVGAGNLAHDQIIRVTDLVTADLRRLAAYPEEHHSTLSEYKRRLETYQFSTVQVREAPLDVATEIFTRINVTGQPLTVFEIMVAKTFDAEVDFDLADEFEELNERLGEVGFETISATVVLQLVALVLHGECTKKDILGLARADFIAVWPEVVAAVAAAVDYFRGHFNIPVSRLLPYGSVLIPFAYFFLKKGGRPDATQQDLLKDFFWRVSLGGRYSFAVESKLAADKRKIDAILEGRDVEYEWAVDSSPEFIASNGWFSANRSYCKALLCILAQQQPKSFADGSSIRIANDWLLRANSKNYHHVFPRAYLRRTGVSFPEPNHIANISIVDDYLNKRQIRDRAPSDYMAEFQTRNRNFEADVRSHLIDPDASGLWSDDYRGFFAYRCAALAEEVKKRVVDRTVDAMGQAVLTDDIDPEDAQSE